MTDRLLRDRDVAAMLGTTPGVAASILSQRGVHAVDFGMGRGRGRRWLESAVQQVIAEMHAEAQPQKRTKEYGLLRNILFYFVFILGKCAKCAQKQPKMCPSHVPGHIPSTFLLPAAPAAAAVPVARSRSSIGSA